MFAKLSLMSLMYEMIETFCFPNENTKQMFEEYKKEKTILNNVLTDTDSTNLFFMFSFKSECGVVDEKFRDFIFQIIGNNSVLERFDTLHEFLEKFSIRNAKFC